MNGHELDLAVWSRDRSRVAQSTASSGVGDGLDHTCTSYAILSFTDSFSIPTVYLHVFLLV